MGRRQGKKPDDGWTPFPRTSTGKVDRAEIRRRYEVSPNLEWIPFCMAQNWPAESLRKMVNAGAWVDEKRRRLENEFTASLSDFSSKYRKEWIKDVEKTLDQYPKAVDNVMALASLQMQHLVKELQSGKIRSGEITALAIAMKTCVEAKKSILMLSDTVAKVQNARPTIDEASDTEWKMSLKGQKDVTPKQLGELMLQYLDPSAPEPKAEPQPEPEPEPEVHDAES